MSIVAHTARFLLFLAVLLASLAGLFFPACGAGISGTGGAGGAPPPPSLEIHNQSQFPLEEIRAHETKSYLTADNLLAGAAPLGEEEIFIIEAYVGSNYITVIRRRTAHGDRVAVTTAAPIEAPYDGFVLIVFDDSFRLMRP